MILYRLTVPTDDTERIYQLWVRDPVACAPVTGDFLNPIAAYPVMFEVYGRLWEMDEERGVIVMAHIPIEERRINPKPTPVPMGYIDALEAAGWKEYADA